MRGLFLVLDCCGYCIIAIVSEVRFVKGHHGLVPMTWVLELSNRSVVMDRAGED